jgi:hypothetical protein
MARTSPAMTENDMEISDWPFVSCSRSEATQGRRDAALGCFVAPLLAMTGQLERTLVQS